MNIQRHPRLINKTVGKQATKAHFQELGDYIMAEADFFDTTAEIEENFLNLLCKEIGMDPEVVSDGDDGLFDKVNDLLGEIYEFKVQTIIKPGKLRQVKRLLQKAKADSSQVLPVDYR